ncbi:MAG: carbonic anhydrase [Cyanobacteria bacterium SZAS-4]|nr:carbonic anhydrase [Cyanobacteria bacterium SZAS-4]
MKKQTCLLNLFAFALIASIPTALAAVTPDASIQALKDGNTRYINGKSIHPRIDADRRKMTALEGQTPISAILGCADSRVPPEIIFDQGFADLFVVRVAGNVCAVPEIASIEYAVAVLKVPSIVVIGHTKCGAVDAAIKNGPLPGSLPDLVKMIRPAVETCEKDKTSKTDLLTRATEQNVRNTIADLSKSPVIKEAIDSKKLKIVGAIRHIKDGHVSWLK